ncbi:undecaprenyl pyrophosphate synthase [[Clostridium] ultunense Esp]|uniref:isoprenyl transferase n=1 Tax=Thermicanus aegyptius TaxID=94009 RepID=UPI0002B70A78|nr:isoprenyl transferase [Thermicanus aegyptius]CCQ97937.1 undecaprenyl pyrophosphate synthase [[Clostridium] ultunense Esp]
MKSLNLWPGREKSPSKEDGEGKIPQHIAIIMDGNGRWAKERGMPRVVGHRAGMKTVKEITKAADEVGVKILTLYAFSTENWKRPKEEVDFLMRLPEEFLELELEELIVNNVQVRMIGDKEGLPSHTVKAVEKAIQETKDNSGLILNFALNYGGRKEILDAVKAIARKVEKRELSPDSIDEQFFHQYLLTPDYPDPDLLIRTSGEIRLSNFMLWQLAYTEFWFSDKYWPDFHREDFLEAVEAYKKRERKFGRIKS